MTTQLVDQPTAAPTRKVTAAMIGAAIGGAVGNITERASELSRWLEWLVVPEVNLLIVTAAAGAGAFLAGYFVRERAAA